MNKEKLISELSIDVRPGASNTLFSKDVVPQEKSAELNLLTGSSVSKLGEIEIDLLSPAEVKEGKNASRFLLKSGDVVLLAKGNALRAAYVDDDVAAINVVTSGNFILIRTNQEHLLGEVLVTYLNSKQGMTALDSQGSGAVIKHVSAASLKKMQVPVPSPQEQQKIAKLFHARNKAHRDTLALAEQQKKLSDACMEQLLIGEVS